MSLITAQNYLDLLNELVIMGMDDDVLTELHDYKIKRNYKASIQSSQDWFTRPAGSSIREGNQRNYARMLLIREVYKKANIPNGNKAFLMQLATQAFALIPPK